ncbi:MAG: universal stress protein [Pseudanabaenaceae cyanobacterium SKYGB_i_bin29]|nr:universal stress protein [Pseudanabaenaceae cyanobacterium SKYG29]MDW8421035.1 universal stress protein [Pseudanabaenaceae cyanobacterium SKYGB_i_bin29]
MQTFLVAIDGSNVHQKVIDKVIELATPGKTYVILLTVVEPLENYLPPVLLPTGDWVTLPLPVNEETEKKLRESVSLVLKQASDRLSSCNIANESRIESGSPREMICHVAGEINPTVLVLGSRGLGSIERLMLGSVSDYVVHHAPCPVLIVR